MSKQRDKAAVPAKAISGEALPAGMSKELLQELQAEGDGDWGKGTVASSDEESDATPDEDDPWQGPSSMPPPLERLLLAIIRAHPNEDMHDGERLDQAMSALVGCKASRFVLAASAEGKLTGKDKDLEALEWMHEQWQEDAQEQYKIKAITQPSLRPTLRSVRRLAQEAAQKFHPRQDHNYNHSDAERLRNKFSGHLGSSTRLGTSIPARAVPEHGWVKETVEWQSLEVVCEQLRKWGVGFLPDWEEK